MRGFFGLLLLSPVLSVPLAGYEKAASIMIPDKVYCGSDGSKVFAWDFKQAKLIKLTGPGRAARLTTVDSFEPGVKFSGVQVRSKQTLSGLQSA